MSKKFMEINNGFPIEVSTASEMDEVISNAQEDDLGKMYKYIGETTDKYEKDGLYIISNIS